MNELAVAGAIVSLQRELALAHVLRKRKCYHRHSEEFCKGGNDLGPPRTWGLL